MEYLVAAISLGFLGSFHCIGMCGPIALALPLSSRGKMERMIGSLLYNTGRALTYAAFGFLFGLLGKGFVIAGYQQWLSVALGILILFLVFIPAKLERRLSLLPVIGAFISRIKTSLSSLFKTKGYTSVFTIGVLNGLLPCGLVYMGIAGAIATGSPLNGALFMLFFGMGTWPVMVLLTLSGQSLSAAVRSKIRSAVPVFVAITASLLILRGMNLDIPYLSPQFNQNDCTKTSCCHKP